MLRFGEGKDGDTGACHYKRALYNFLIYCNLFHYSITEAYGQLSSTIKLLSAKFRHHWMLHCMPEIQVIEEDEALRDYPLDD